MGCGQRVRLLNLRECLSSLFLFFFLFFLLLCIFLYIFWRLLSFFANSTNFHSYVPARLKGTGPFNPFLPENP